ncbi:MULTISPECIES: CHAT domain-containing protein [unclassified Streptomyces]|uniref:CHAT domain-containing protein n=1 Tax=unclassified Streptomyces TaxID=2593676 RepID=UPI000DAC7C90|nr:MULTISPECIES: CHAT domain-containing protein [unclassified Streptomyces]PZT73679.1 CHAT domain-containing protein [Streptomyces sp. AC1-42T]PZT83328.1 CHAT domain-containing protein [Streptomyces sp. AC1-42W]
MGEEEQTGSVLALQAWATEAVGRARALLPAPGAKPPPSRVHDASVAELGDLSVLLDHDPELRSSVTVWLGGALTLRHAAGGGTLEDRHRANGLLRDVRDPATELGAAASAEDRRWASLFLLTHTLPFQEMLDGLAPEPDVTAIFDLMTRQGPEGIAAFTAEIGELLDEAVELPLPPELLGDLRRMRDLRATPSPEGFADMLNGFLPDDGHPATEHVRQMVNRMMTGMSGGRDGEADGGGGRGAHGTGTTSTPGAESTGDDSVSATVPPGPPGPPGPEEVRRLLAAMQAVNTTSVDFVDHVGGGDPAALNQQLGRLRSALDELPADMRGRDALEGLMGLLLAVSDGAGGTLQDQAVGFEQTHAITDYLRRKAGSDSIPFADAFPVAADALALMTDIRVAGQNHDADRLGKLVARAEALVDGVPDDHDLRSFALLCRGMAGAALGRFTLDEELLLRSLTDIEEAKEAAQHSRIPFPFAEPDDMFPDISTLRSYLTDDTTGLPEREVPPPDAPADRLHTAANHLGMRFGLTRDPEDLAAAITTLERLREHIRQGRAPRVAAESLWSLSELYRARWRLGPNEADAEASVETATEALTTLAADVLLQQGAEHRLTTARNGASLGVRAALWAAMQGRPDHAVAALELGRALVLQTAATSRAVPDLLEERGHPELAAAWRESVVDADGGPPRELPSMLRRQALEALGYRKRGGLLGTPDPRELAEGVGAAGADALVYLVPGPGGDAPGMVLAVGPEIGIRMGALPTLAEESSGPLERYLDAVRARSAAPRDAAVAKDWEEALSDLCDWAYETIAHVLAGLADHLPGDPAERRTPRIVLVPCGRLGIVPWHAARFPAGSPHAYVCEELVISYAASGSQLLRAARRAPRDPVSAPAMVADPTFDLTYAELEILELREAFYPGARLYGGFADLPVRSVPTGTPAQLLSLLAQDHSVVHLATHGMAAVRPTESALYLAHPEIEGESEPLSVIQLLDRPQPAGQEPSDGPLIVLSACETDLSTRDHDEALTLTTAFVSGGARDVVGSRWTTQDSASMLLMVVFHYHLRAGLAPVDALRAAQLWMLDPDRQDPGCLSDRLRRDVRRADLGQPAAWAAFIHQGHPGRGKETV